MNKQQAIKKLETFLKGRHITIWSYAGQDYRASVLASYREELKRLNELNTELLEALEMVRDADNDCHADGLSTIPKTARKKIDAAIAKARGE